MTEDEVRDRIDQIAMSVVGASNIEGEIGDAQVLEPACEAAARELGVSHEYFHKIVNSIALVSPAYGVAPETFCFIVARKWGLMEAAEGLISDVPDVPPDA